MSPKKDPATVIVAFKWNPDGKFAGSSSICRPLMDLKESSELTGVTAVPNSSGSTVVAGCNVVGFSSVDIEYSMRSKMPDKLIQTHLYIMAHIANFRHFRPILC